MMIDQPTQYGFIGGGYVVVTPDKDAPYSSITGFGTTGTLFRDDGQTFPWKGINPFDCKLNNYGGFLTGGSPVYMNVTTVPNAPKNVPGARNDIWTSGPQMSVYGGKHRLGGGWLCWLYPIAPGEVLKLTVGAGGYADDREYTYQPNVVVHSAITKTEDDDSDYEWVMASKDGKTALLRSTRRYYYQVNVTSVVRTDNVSDPYRINKTRYDVTMTIQQLGRVRVDVEEGGWTYFYKGPLYTLSEAGKVVPVDFYVRTTSTVEMVKVREELTYPTSDGAGHPMGTPYIVEYGYYLEDYTFSQKIGSISFDFHRKNAEDGWSRRQDTGEILPYGTDSFDLPALEITHSLIGIDIGTDDIDVGSFSDGSHTLNVMPLTISESTSHVDHHVYYDLTTQQVIPEDKILRKNANASYVRAISPDRIFLSDNPNDQSVFFV
ncbi:hypothetical protein [Paludibacterium denitrificans]|uniref:Uncharacterized protein n=2 Tax=Paludibacterium denitrificans TaxID=2675226 RepID=A0A844G9P4_9NEIS|nr:hypothetical protein [Paludibacterium denitrificans]MTD32502.1 hypothetical protein [Paludibacterium denitrificans]